MAGEPTFAERLRALWMAAGSPDLNALARRARVLDRRGHPAGKRVSDWMNPKGHRPATWEKVHPLVKVLIGMVASSGGFTVSTRELADEGRWRGWFDQARSFRAGSDRQDVNVSDTTVRTALPSAPAGFFGRDSDLEIVLNAFAAGAGWPTAVCVSGLPGVGKTALALVAAHRAQEMGMFATTLFVDLLGYRDAPANPADVLAVVLRGMDVDVQAAGSNRAEREYAYQARLADLARQEHPVLIVVDNAAEADAVRPLIPPSGPHRLLVTSRHTLHTLDARLIDLPVLSGEASTLLLVDAMRTADPGDLRTRTGAEALTALARLCGGLPLAVRIVAALLIREPHLTLSALVEEIVEIGLMDGLDDGERSVRAALTASYRRLSSELAEMFCLLALNPGPDLSTEAAEVLTGLHRSVLRRRLAELDRVHLLDGRRVAGRWWTHDLVRAFGAECVQQKASAQDTYGRTEQQRLLEYYRARLEAADAWVRGFAVPTAKFPDHREGLRWLDAEHVNLLYAVETAAAICNPREAVRLALGLADYLRLRHLHIEAAWVAGVAEQVAPTPFERAQLLDNRGNALMAVGMFDEAIALHEQALELFREQGEEEGAAIALMSIGVTLRNAGRPEEAVTRHRQARAIFQRVGPPYYVAAVWNNLAYAWLDSGNFDQALRAAEKAVAIFQTLGNVVGAMRALSIRSSVLLRLQRHQEALEAARLAVVCAVKARKAPTELGQLLLASAEAALAAGRSWDESRATLEAAAAAFDEGGWQDIGDKIRRVADRTAVGEK